MTLVILLGIIASLALDYSIYFIHIKVEYGALISYTLKAISYLIAFVIFMFVLLRSDNYNSKLIWLIVIIIMPLLGIFLFLSFSNNFKHTRRYNKRKSEIDGKRYVRYEKENTYESNSFKILDDNIKEIFKSCQSITGHATYVSDSRIEVLTNGDEFFPRLIEKMQEAKEYIIMEFFIIKTDTIGQQVLSTLKEKAMQGLKVILIYDALGSMNLDGKFMKSLEKAGVEIRIFDRIKFPLFNSKINNRNHRKITVIDGKYSFIGGHNLGDEYNHMSKKYGFWRDTHLQIEGPAINSSLEIINKDYYYITGKFLDLEPLLCNTPISNSYNVVQTIQSGPDSPVPIIRNTYIKMINSARRSIKIITPYLVLDPEFITALKTAAMSGIKVDLIIPGLPDKKIVYKCSESFITTLLDVGVNVYKYKDTFTHAKVMVIDDVLASCGTFNMDVRSFIINFEVTTLFTGIGVDKLVADFDDDFKNSEQILIPEWNKRSIILKTFEGVVNILAPLM